MAPRSLRIPHSSQVPLDEVSGELADGQDTTVITLPYGSDFSIAYTGPNANGIEVNHLLINSTTSHD